MAKCSPGQPKNTSQDKPTEASVTKAYPPAASLTKKLKKFERAKAARSQVLSPHTPESQKQPPSPSDG